MNSPTAAGDRAARHLTPEDLAGLRAGLDEQLRFHRERSAGGRPAAPAPARMVVADVEAALRRMDEGRYGSCHRCGLPVERQRLLIVPQARYCAPCQRLRAAPRPATADPVPAAAAGHPVAGSATAGRRAAGHRATGLPAPDHRAADR
ncbi:TraR/DksA C4-type zinc finger protein [Streptomyces chilikensis]|uniref:TraR/DksA family transcriptional regulator n=1 Tax=Streptomyces chilikensis TaxID=1194079 RepID=UPI0030B89F39